MITSGFLRAPRLWPADGRDHRRVTWTELFFDLIFVAAVAQVGGPLREAYSAEGVLRYAFLFVLIWWAWMGHTLYATRFETDDGLERLLTLCQTFLAAVMAANAREALDSRSSAGFSAAYAGLRIVLVVQYLRARRVPQTRGLTTRYAIGFGAAALLWMASALLDVPERYWLWGAALAIDFATPWLASSHGAKFPPDATHFPERFGLFTIILLGEFVAAVMKGIESQEFWSFTAASTAFTSLAFAFALRWWYFDVARSADARHVRSRRELTRFHLWEYAHLPLFLGIGVAGAGFEHAIGLGVDGRLGAAEAWILTAAVALVMASLIAIGAASEEASRRPGLVRRLCLQTALLCLVAALGPAAHGLDRLALAVALLAVCGAQGMIAGAAGETPKVRAQTSELVA